MLARLSRSPAAARGVGLIEMMVAIVLGLFLVGAGAGLLVGQIGEQRRRLLQVRLDQELRSAAALIERDLRRAGHWGAAAQAVWAAGSDTPRPANPYIDVVPAAGEAAVLGYSYTRDAAENGSVDSNERFGWRVNAGTRALEMRLGGAALVPAAGDAWQAATDPAVVRITRLAFTPATTTVDLSARCVEPCPAASTTCPPRLTLRRVTIEIEAAATADAGLTRVLRSTVHLRADALTGACPGT